MRPTPPSVTFADARGSETPELHPAEFLQIQRLMRGRFGIELRAGKEQLVQARLGKVLRQRKLATFGQLYRDAVGDKTGEALIALADALTTNHTSFFREPAHFAFLRRWFRQEAPPEGPIRIWCAACSTGEEPYTAATCAIEELGPDVARWRVQILASDLSTRVLRIAKRGVYDAARVQSLPLQWKRRHLLEGSGRYAGSYQFKPEVRSLIQFSRINLTEPLPRFDGFSIIFCRNVLIYFEAQTQERVVSQLSGCLAPLGYLLVGHAEGLLAHNHPLEHVSPAVYRKREHTERGSP